MKSVTDTKQGVQEEILRRRVLAMNDNGENNWAEVGGRETKEGRWVYMEQAFSAAKHLLLRTVKRFLFWDLRLLI